MFNWLRKLANALSRPEKPERPTMRTCIHESGHYMVSWLFLDYVDIRFITTDPKSMDKAWNGGFKFGLKAKGGESLEDAERVMLILSAGIVATTIFTKGIQYCKDNIGKFPNDSTKLDSIGGDVDYNLMQQRAYRIGASFRLNDKYVQWNGFQYVFYYLMVDDIWQCLNVIAQALHDADDRKLTNEQLNTLITSQHNYERLKNIKASYLKTRYPLTRDILRHVVTN